MKGESWGRASRVRSYALVLLATASLIVSAHPQTYTVLHTFTGGTDGIWPEGGVIRDGAGNVYGTTEFGGKNLPLGNGILYKVSKTGHETILHSFNVQDGLAPFGSLIEDAAGNLYGTTSEGGAYNAGTVFKVDRFGNETVLHNFSGGDGADPLGGLIADAQGNLYGTAAEGGDFDYGVVYKMDADGNVTVLHSFNLTQGAYPGGELVMDAKGALYGATASGGVGACDEGCGSIFKINAAGKFSVLHLFRRREEGWSPESSLILDKNGTLYGTTDVGGDVNCSIAGSVGCGVIFALSASGRYTVLHAFHGAIQVLDGAFPNGGLGGDSAGNLYGMTYYGGHFDNGSIFKLDPAGKLTVLYSFGDGPSGRNPVAGLIRDSAGSFYGTTLLGGDLTCQAPDGCGTVFKFTPQ